MASLLSHSYKEQAVWTCPLEMGRENWYAAAQKVKHTHVQIRLFLSHFKEFSNIYTGQNSKQKKLDRETKRERKQVLSNPHFKPGGGYILIWAACGTSFNPPTTSAPMDHVVPQKTQCESIFYLVLFSASTLIYKEKPHSLRMMCVCTS